ncbi:DUF2059 domain-containing protein [Roseobacter denitrificans]|uniref:DUF2059 domain-containing protein n=1 Tax=Roseobacter denitrificans (strain ATCC 33942 / OCh 114) TaxID=375451 RepID=Q165Y1_ROSDO|nr:DUF2059 domain-containing protein [Roseobacter denitrificans]ABG32212.1 hypothetical protein RD1_2666 [Roseobacter denitrificans OCh 114]AVL51708.1 DUF2059 domain-containing protein [Roseobacter denitrificans]SFF78767.1 hypothetical protein SAMN05443635_102175 [Roseobacter denitrificans OCh 114]
MRAVLLAVGLSICASPLWANARMTVLMDVLRISEVVDILREEGFSYAKTLDGDMLNGQGGAFWQAQVDQIYDVEIITEQIRQALEQGLNEDDIDAALAFFSSDAGVRIIELENAARRAMMDPDVEDAARDLFLSLQGSDDPLFQHVSRFIEVNDLLERNVSGAMSSNYQFYKGLADGRYTAESEDEILAQVWAQQEDIRADTNEWLNGFLLMAYQPLPAEMMEGYMAYAQTPEGQALNAALFEGFETVYRDISYALGRAVALNADGDEI